VSLPALLRRLTTPGPLLAFGLGVTTIAGSLYLAAANRAVDDVKPVLALYFLIAAIGIGVLAGLEQEMTRTVARARALGVAVGPAVRGQLRQAAGLAAVTSVLMAAGSPVIVSHWLAGDWAMFAALLVGLASTWSSFLVRGVLAGCQDFKYYTLTLVVEGVARMAPALLLAVAGIGSALVFGLVFALGPLFAAASGLLAPSLRRSWAADSTGSAVEVAPETGDSARAKLTLLTLATLVSQLVMNAVPLVVIPRLDKDLGGAVGSAMGLSRLALLCLFPLQAPLLPLLAASAAHGDFADVRKKVRFLIAACLGAGVLGVAASMAAGPWLLRHYFGTKAPLSGGFLAGMAASTAFLMTAFVLQSAQVALNRHRMVLVGWSAGLTAMGAIFALPLAALDAAVWAAVAGGLVVTLIMAADVIMATRSGSGSSQNASVILEPVAEGAR
jgi:O-antigen/teichoic acid export membrane protein